jgi:carboxyl-terminal processing protease
LSYSIQRLFLALPRWLRLTVGLAAGVSAAGAEKTATADWSEIRAQTFAAVWGTVNESYFDPTFGGVDWAAVGERYRGKLAEVDDADALRGLLTQMLHELKRSHFAIQPRQLAVFTPAERVRIGTSGVETVYAEGQVVIGRLTDKLPGAEAGLRLGDVVVRFDELELGPTLEYLAAAELTPARRAFYAAHLVNSRLRGPVGSKARLVVRREGGVEVTVELAFAAHEGEWSEPMGDFPSTPVEVFGAVDERGLGYLRFNCFVRQAMKEIRRVLRAVPADGGLVIDLRGNPGGISIMAPGISGWLSDRKLDLGTMHLRQGHMGFTVSPQPGAFLGPVALLIDGSSASTSEIMAAGLQEAGRVRVFGETSPGAALPSLFKELPTGDLLQYAIADVQTPRGVLIEGRGVMPDEVVLRTVEDLRAGRDPVRAAAERWLEQSRPGRRADATEKQSHD